VIIRRDLEQGSWEWAMARCGIPTASQFHRIMTPEKRGLSGAAEGYVQELVAERLLGAPVDNEYLSQFVDRGTDLEPEARNWYAFDCEVTVEQVGFVLTDDEKVGCSPDGLVGTDGMIEVKVPNAKRHVEMILGGFPAKMTQVQGGMWVCEREWCDVIAHNPSLPNAVIRVWRDDAYIKDLRKAMGKFLAGLEKAMEQVRALGDGDAFREIRPKAPKEVAPDPNVLTLDDIDALRADLAAVRRLGILPAINEARVLKWATDGKWLEARMAWTAVNKALENPELYGSTLATLGVAP
jgi:hypothetical protein